MKQIERAKQLLLKYRNLLQCPICRTGLHPGDGYSLVCQNRHTFDLSKTGSVHLHPNHREQAKYSRALFESRQILCKNGFFDGLIRQVGNMGLHHLQKIGTAPIRAFDAGCGEGSHLAQCIGTWQSSGVRDVLGVGIDLSKEAIRLASRTYPGLVWCVADLSDCPLQDNQFHIILNLFSPANYAEMSRLLHPDGILIKVIPGADYLVELRELLYERKDKQRYANDRMIAHFRERFGMADITQVRYNQPLRPEEWEHLIRMTPLSWGAKEEAEKVLRSGLDAVTVDAVILMGKKSDAVETHERT